MSHTESEIAKAREALEAFRDCDLRLSDLLQTLGGWLSVNVHQGVNKKTVEVAWLGPKGLEIMVDRQHVMKALNATLDRLLEAAELRDWSEFLIMLDDCFVFANEDKQPGVRVIPDVLHYLADNPPAAINSGGLSYLRQCLILGTLPDSTLL